MSNTNPQYPQNRPVWNDTDIEAGEFVSSDNGQLQLGHKVKAGETIPFGVFVDLDPVTKEISLFSATPDVVPGISLISNQVKNYAEREYLEGEVASVARRGFVSMKINPNFPPVPEATTVIYISTAPGFEGTLTGPLDTQKFSMSFAEAVGVEVIRVGAETAEVYLSGVLFKA